MGLWLRLKRLKIEIKRLIGYASAIVEILKRFKLAI
nr:MAG TPA: hypothetical protein [Caudoviricetes sp.]